MTFPQPVARYGWHLLAAPELLLFQLCTLETEVFFVYIAKSESNGGIH